MGESEVKNMSEVGVAGVGAEESVGLGGGGAVGDWLALAGDVGRGCWSEKMAAGNNRGAVSGAEVECGAESCDICGAEDDVMAAVGNGGGGGGGGGGGVGKGARG